MKIMAHNDNYIRGFFKHYNTEMTEVVSENAVWRKPKGFDERIFCGTFVAKVYVGMKVMGTYKFDCTDFNAPVVPDNARVRLTKIA